MKSKIRKLLSCLPKFLEEYLGWFFYDAAENQIRISKSKKNEFRSYTQLKKHQKNIKLFFMGLFSALLFILIGLIIGPTFFPKQLESELYIPNGKGDILIGNISKNQATIVFKTLDSANANKPIATKAHVEVFSDVEQTKLVRRSLEDDYAVTHVIPIDSLQENKVHYVRIVAQDSSMPIHSRVVNFWGDESDPIKFYTAGELISNCQNPTTLIDVEKKENLTVSIAPPLEYVENDDEKQEGLGLLRISGVANESYLQPKNRVQTIISWGTNIGASTILIYREGSSGEKMEIVVSEKMQTKHAATLTTLKASTTYYFNAKSVDENGSIAMSEEYSLKTPKPQLTIVQQIKDSFMAIFKSIKPR